MTTIMNEYDNPNIIHEVLSHINGPAVLFEKSIAILYEPGTTVNIDVHKHDIDDNEIVAIEIMQRLGHVSSQGLAYAREQKHYIPDNFHEEIKRAQNLVQLN